MKMATDPPKMFESDSDWDKVYDFDKVSLQKKMEFIELVFQRQLNLIESIHDGELLQLELNRYEKVFREHRHNMVFDLNGKFTFYEFSSFFASFF